MSRSHYGKMLLDRKHPLATLDDYPTPPWATRALLKYVIDAWNWSHAWEPACNRGAMAEVLRKEQYGSNLVISDIHDYGYGGDDFTIVDFIKPEYWPADIQPKSRYPTIVITNPPFNQAEDFVHTALDRGLDIAVLVRQGFIESKGRYKRLFKDRPPSKIYSFVERLNIWQGELKPETGGPMPFMWLVWQYNLDNYILPTPEFNWIPPCRAELERDGDYR